MADRRPFEEKYEDLPSRWNVSSDIVNYIIRRYSKKLQDELSRLKEEGIKLPKFFRDRRTDEEYVFDLIDGWLVEDIVCDAWLRDRILSIDKTVQITHMGTNRDRTLQKFNPRKITTEPDFAYLTKSKCKVQIELQVAREARPREGYDMKVSKVNRARKSGNIFLWVVIPDDAFFFLDPVADITGEPRANPLWGGKEVYTLTPAQLSVVGTSPMQGSIPQKWHKRLEFKDS